LLAFASGIEAAHQAPPTRSDVIDQLRLALAKPEGARRTDVDTRLAALYAARNFQPLWTSRHDEQVRINKLRERLQNADDDGLDPRRYELEALDSEHTTATALALADMAATRAYVAFLLDLHASSKEAIAKRHPSARKRSLKDLTGALTAAAEADDLEAHLAKIGPQHHIYQGMRTALARYRTLARAGGWPRLPTGPILKPGMEHGQVLALRKRLFASGDLIDAELDSEWYDRQLQSAVEVFQARHGLNVDGHVGPNTRSALNIDVEKRIRQLVINLERARWLPVELGNTFVMVNIPGYRLNAFEEGYLALDMAVIVGRRQRNTPMYSGELEWMEFNPYWGIPDSIARQDILPKLRENPSYLEGLRVYTKGQSYPYVELDRYGIDWSGVVEADFPYYFRQDPGPGNALGQVKFLFRNPHNVYLHDTPNRSLFAHTRRAFSSGCIRLGEPLKMAQFMLRGESQEWDQSRIDKTLEEGKNVRLTLARKVAVHLVYHTAWLSDDGRVQFRADIYKKDESLAKFVNSERFKPELDAAHQAFAGGGARQDI
jgi:murein L,D-transpeptidase YcbB/YkuD